jgi:3-oxoacyl-ACP reductase-like protein
MSIFSNILAKLGFGSAHAATPAGAPSPATAGAATPAAAPAPAAAVPAAPAAPAAISVVDVVSQLEALAAKSAEKLNWRTSIVDLMKLLGLDSSFAARKELATELACPADRMADSAQMNMWLHKTVLQKLADNGGNIPADLLH